MCKIVLQLVQISSLQRCRDGQDWAPDPALEELPPEGVVQESQAVSKCGWGEQPPQEVSVGKGDRPQKQDHSQGESIPSYPFLNLQK